MQKPEWNRPQELAAAEEISRKAWEYWERIKAATERDGYDSDAKQCLCALVPPGLYEHFKSTEDKFKFYAVDGVHFEVNDTSTPRVAYTALYAPHAGESSLRPLFDSPDAFFGPINRPTDPINPWVGARFRIVRRLSLENLGFLKDRAEPFSHLRDRHAYLHTITQLL